MIRTYWTLALRNVRKHRVHALINITGLAIGIACFLLILLFIRDELSYDRFHSKADQIYRLTTHSSFGTGVKQPGVTLAALAGRYPEIQAYTRLSKQNRTVRHGDTFIEETRFFYADAAVFEVFDFPLIAGDPTTALTQPNTLVLTPATAQKYFGDTSPVGRSLTFLDGTTYQVTGVIQEAPTNSHVHFDMLASFATLEPFESPWSAQSYGYMVIATQEAAASLQMKLDALTDGDITAISEALGWATRGMSFGLQPLTTIHVTPNYRGEIEPTTDPRYLYIFSAIALLILVIACINYMNLATARSARRAREVGVRKVLGANRTQVRQQFMIEAVLFAGIALIFALMLVELCLPLFNSLSGKSFTHASYLQLPVLLTFLGIAVVVGGFAGSYPAFFLSRFQPIDVLKAGLRRGRSGNGLRKVLVVFQFGISIALIGGTIVVQGQLDYMQNKRLGYETDQVLEIDLPGADQLDPQTFKQEVLDVAGVTQAALGDGTPMSSWWAYFREDTDGQRYQVREINVGHDYVKTLGMEVIDGRDFSAEFPTDAESGVLLNETAARLMKVADKVGQQVEVKSPRDQPETLLGIVRDFHTSSLHEAIPPTILSINQDRFTALVVRIQPGNMTATLEALEETWTAFVPDAPFQYQFFDEQFASLYRAEQRLGHMSGIFSLLAVFIACLGLFGLAAYTTEQRTKEIGVRKVLGASVKGLVALLTQDFVKLVVLAFLLAGPIAYVAMEYWLQAFAYRTDVGMSPFLLAGGAALGVALLTVSYQAIKAARANPVDSLRYE